MDSLTRSALLESGPRVSLMDFLQIHQPLLRSPSSGPAEQWVPTSGWTRAHPPRRRKGEGLQTRAVGRSCPSSSVTREGWELAEWMPSCRPRGNAITCLDGVYGKRGHTSIAMPAVRVDTPSHTLTFTHLPTVDRHTDTTSDTRQVLTPTHTNGQHALTARVRGGAARRRAWQTAWRPPTHPGVCAPLRPPARLPARPRRPRCPPCAPGLPGSLGRRLSSVRVFASLGHSPRAGTQSGLAVGNPQMGERPRGAWNSKFRGWALVMVDWAMH